jgi:hypothetical protein
MNGNKAAVAAGLWLGAAGLGLGALWHYETRPGQLGAPEASAPASPVELDELSYNLILFAHPHCPCSRASFAELASLVAATEHRLSVRVLFFWPHDADESWERSFVWRQAEALGARVEADVDGRQAKRFGALTSGTVMLFAPSGKLLYRGGITGARGHVGDNAGRRAVLAALSTRRPVPSESVFGCSLQTSHQEASWTSIASK